MDCTIRRRTLVGIAATAMAAAILGCASTPPLTTAAMESRGYTPAIAATLSALSFRDQPHDAFFTPQNRGDWWEIDYYAPWPRDDGYLLNLQRARATAIVSNLSELCEGKGGSHDEAIEGIGPVHVRAEIVCRKQGRVLFMAKLAPSRVAPMQGSNMTITSYRVGVIELKNANGVHPKGYETAVRKMGGGGYL